MVPKVIRDPTTSLAVLLAPVVGRIIGPGETTAAIRAEIVDAPPASVDYQFWRAGTWFILLAAAAAGALALVVLGDALDSAWVTSASAVLLALAAPALVMLALFAARYGYVSKPPGGRVPEKLLRSTVLDLVVAVAIAGLAVGLLR